MLYLPIKIGIVIVSRLHVAIMREPSGDIFYNNEHAFILVEVTADKTRSFSGKLARLATYAPPTAPCMLS